MTEHLPECTYSPGQSGFGGINSGISSTQPYFPPSLCICNQLRDCEKRVTGQVNREWAEVSVDAELRIWNEALDAAREAVDAVQGYDELQYPGQVSIQHVALAAIDALTGCVGFPVRNRDAYQPLTGSRVRARCPRDHLPAEPGPHILECPSSAVECTGEYCDCDEPHLCVCVYLRAYETRMLAMAEAPSKGTLPRNAAVAQAISRAAQAEAFRDGHAAAVVEFMTNHGDDATFLLGYRQALLDAQNAVTALDPATQATSKTQYQTRHTKEDT